MALILRIDVDRPYGKRGFVRHVASRVASDFHLPRINRLGYLQLSTQQLQAKQVQYVLWSHDFNARMSDFAVFYDFLQKHYRRVWTFSNQDEVWERKTPS